MINQSERIKEKRKGVAFICVGLSYYVSPILDIITDQGGVNDVLSLFVLVILIILLLKYLRDHGGFDYYGIKKAKRPQTLLYFTPLLIIAFHYVLGGFAINYQFKLCVLRICISAALAILESVLYHGLLMKAWSETNPDRALIGTSISFGLMIACRTPAWLNQIEVFCHFTALSVVYSLFTNHVETLVPCIVHHTLYETMRVFQKPQITETINQRMIMWMMFLIVIGYYIFMLRWCKDGLYLCDEKKYEEP